MTLGVYKNTDGSYTVKVENPHKSWLDKVAKAMDCNTTIVLAFALTNGLMHLYSEFVKPVEPEIPNHNNT